MNSKSKLNLHHLHYLDRDNPTYVNFVEEPLWAIEESQRS